MAFPIIAIIAVLFLATFIRSAFGFGEALVAVPLLALFLPIKEAAPVAVLVSVTIAGVVLLQDWRCVHLGSAWRLIVSTLFGIPLGLYLLAAAPEPLVKGVLGGVIVLFSAYSLVRHGRIILTNDRLAWAFGFAAGVLGGAYGMNGPPLAIYGALRGWSPRHFRATLQAYFLPASLVGLGGYYLMGLWTPVVTRDYLRALPAVLAAIFLGRFANQRMKERSFLAYVHVGLIVIGATLLVESVARSGGLPRGQGDGGGEEAQAPRVETQVWVAAAPPSVLADAGRPCGRSDSVRRTVGPPARGYLPLRRGFQPMSPNCAASSLAGERG